MGANSKTRVHHYQGEYKGWLMHSATIHRDFQKIELHNYVNKEITIIRSNDIMMYARGKHTQLTLVERCARNMGWVARSMLEW